MAEHVFDLLNRVEDMLADGLDAVRRLGALSHRQDALLGLVDLAIDIFIDVLAAMLIGIMDVQRAGVDHLPQHVLVEQHLLVELVVRADWDEAVKLGDRARTADLVDDLLLAQGVGQRGDVQRDVAVVKGLQRFVNDAVGGMVERLQRNLHPAFAQSLGRVLQNAAEHAFLRLVAERQRAVDIGQQFLRARLLLLLAVAQRKMLGRLATSKVRGRFVGIRRLGHSRKRGR